VVNKELSRVLEDFIGFLIVFSIPKYTKGDFVSGKPLLSIV